MNCSQRRLFAKRGLLLLLCIILFFAGSACSNDSEGQVFRYDVSGPIENLDPQFAADVSAIMALSHLYEGLVLADSGGAIQPGVASRYTVSDDLRTYTFYLREDAVWPLSEEKDWPGGDAVVAEDFLFSFLRIFRDHSPHAWKYAAISGAEAVQSGEAEQISGVTAIDAHTLQIKLDQPDPLFLQRLAEPAAAPCNRELYARSRGRYGLESAYVYGNGPFQISRWDEVRLSLKRSAEYRSERKAVANAVHFYLGRNAPEQFLDGKTDVAMLTREESEQVGASRAEILPIQKTVWCIVFNQKDPLWGNALLRQGLAQSIDREKITQKMSPNYQPSQLFAPNAMRVMGKPYRALAPGSAPNSFDPAQAQRLFSMGLDSLGLERLPPDAIMLIPENLRSSDAIDVLRQAWQKHLFAYLQFESNTAAQIESRFQSGDFQILLMPLTPDAENVATLFDAFVSTSPQNYCGYSSPLYDALVASAADQSTPELAAAKYAQAETLLLADTVVIPLCFETSYLAVAEGVRDLQISPFGDLIYFKYAQKES